MRNIAFVELDTHAEIVAGFMDLLVDSYEFYIDYYLSQKVFDRIPNPKRDVTIVEPGNLMKKLKDKNYEIVILGTAHRYFNVFERLVNTFPTYIIAHNLNFVKAPKASLLRNVFKEDKAYRLKLLMKEGLLKKNVVYQKARGLFVLSESMVKEQEGRPLRYLPVFYSQYTNKSPQKNVVAIPGTVEQRRRNYKRIFKKVKYFKEQMTFVFLGRVGNHEYKTLKSTEKKLPKNVKIQYFKDRVSAMEFDHRLLQASVLWCPIQETTEFFGIEEVYGKTKISGNIIDAIRFSKPAIFPKTYPTTYSFIFKEEMDIEAQINEINEASFDFTNFDKEIVRHELESVLQSLQ